MPGISGKLGIVGVLTLTCGKVGVEMLGMQPFGEGRLGRLVGAETAIEGALIEGALTLTDGIFGAPTAGSRGAGKHEHVVTSSSLESRAGSGRAGSGRNSADVTGVSEVTARADRSSKCSQPV